MKGGIFQFGVVYVVNYKRRNYEKKYPHRRKYVMNHKRLMTAAMAIILAATTSACGAEVKEPVQPVIETVEKEAVEVPAQDTATGSENGQQTNQTAQHQQQDQENSSGQ